MTPHDEWLLEPSPDKVEKAIETAVAKARGITLDYFPPAKPRWLKTVNRKRGTGESISDSVVRLRQEESS